MVRQFHPRGGIPHNSVKNHSQHRIRTFSTNKVYSCIFKNGGDGLQKITLQFVLIKSVNSQCNSSNGHCDRQTSQPRVAAFYRCRCSLFFTRSNGEQPVIRMNRGGRGEREEKEKKKKERNKKNKEIKIRLSRRKKLSEFIPDGGRYLQYPGGGDRNRATGK